MLNRLRNLKTVTPPSLESSSDTGDIIEIDGDYYVYAGGDPPELISIEYYGREEKRNLGQSDRGSDPST